MVLESRRVRLSLCVVAMTLACLPAAATEGAAYTADWSSIDQRPLPAWFNEAKFGIFVVWGPYSVPAWKDRGYAEWYGYAMNQEGSSTQAFHRRVYGEDFRYEDFVPMFKAEMFDPNFWCDLFVRSGARYVVTTANYHDGFAMWPTTYSRFNETDRWNSVDRGPKRDIIGDLNAAGRKRGLKMGIYYSLYEWYHPLYRDPATRDRYVTEHLHPKFKEVVTRYEPWFIFLDGEWEQSYQMWRTEELAAWLYNESPCKDYVVTNDRWGQCRGEHGDIYESEYGGGLWSTPAHPWQEDRGIGTSYGYNRWESIDDYDSSDTLIRMFSHVAGGGGNYLLCVGPTGDGRIPVIMQQRLLDIGKWLNVNGRAIYGTTASPFWPRQFEWGTVTARPGRLYLHIHDASRHAIALTGLRNRIDGARLLGAAEAVEVTVTPMADGVRLTWPRAANASSVTVVELDVTGAIEVDRTPRQFADGRVSMNIWAMEVHGDRARPLYSGHGDRLRLVDWTDPNEFVTANFVLDRPGVYEVRLDTAVEEGQAGGLFEVELAGRLLSGTVPETQGFTSLEMGQVKIDAPGVYTLAIRPAANPDWQGMALRSLTLIPVSPVRAN